jgi:hypothetical protein
MSAAIDWRAEAGRLSFRDKAFIGGQFVPSAAGRTFDNISPIDGRVLAKIAAGDAEDIDRAVKAARAAFEAGLWADQAPKARKRILVRLAELIQKHANELALLETLDMGKPILNARNGDVRAVAECVRWYGEAIDKLYDQIAPTPKTRCASSRASPWRGGRGGAWNPSPDGGVNCARACGVVQWWEACRTTAFHPRAADSRRKRYRGRVQRRAGVGESAGQALGDTRMWAPRLHGLTREKRTPIFRSRI